MVIVSKAGLMAELVAQLQQYGVEAEPKDAKGRTRARILRAATELFQARGYRHTSIDDVAKHSGVAKGTVYVHFKNKNELLFHAIAEEKKRYVGQFLPLFAEEIDPEERLLRYVELALTMVSSAPLLSKMMSGDREVLLFMEEIDPNVQEQLLASQKVFMAALLEGVGDIDRLSAAEREERAVVLRGVLYAASQLMDERVRGDLGPERYARQLAKMIVRGIGAP